MKRLAWPPRRLMRETSKNRPNAILDELAVNALGDILLRIGYILLRIGKRSRSQIQNKPIEQNRNLRTRLIGDLERLASVKWILSKVKSQKNSDCRQPLLPVYDLVPTIIVNVRP